MNGHYVRRATAETWFERENLEPLRFTAFGPSGRSTVEIEATRDSILERIRLAGGEWIRRGRVRTAGVSILHPSLAHAVAVLAALPLSDAWAGRLGLDHLAVVGPEEITVPVGTFRCWRVESADADRWSAWRAWIAVDRPLVVKLEVGPVPDRSETVLVSFEPAVPDP